MAHRRSNRLAASLSALGLTLLLALSACGSPASLRVEGPASTQAEIVRPAQSEPTERWETPFGPKQIEKALRKVTLSELPQGIGAGTDTEQASPSDSASATGAPSTDPAVAPSGTAGSESNDANYFSYADLEEVLKTCNGQCLMPSSPVSLGGTRFQLWTLVSAGDGWGYAAFAVRDNNGTPQIELMVRGEDVSLEPGKNGTVVSQESVYEKDEPQCCPSGWAARVYRWDDGKFVAAERFTGTKASGSTGKETTTEVPTIQNTPMPTP